MKKCLSLASSIFVIAFAFAAHAADQPIIVKINGPGYTSAEWVRVERCEVYADHATITKQFGAPENEKPVVFSRMEALQLAGGLTALLARAAKEPLQSKPNNLCDAPETRVYSPVRARGEKETVLFSSGGCGAPRLLREGPAADALRGIINTYCPKTFDYDNN